MRRVRCEAPRIHKTTALAGVRGNTVGGTTVTVPLEGVAGQLAIPPREIFLHPGPAGPLYYLQEGLVRLHRFDESGGGMTLRYIKPGGFFGEEGLTGIRRSYFAEAVVHSIVVPLRPDALESQQRDELARHLVGAVAELYRGLERLAAFTLRTRVAAELLVLHDSALAETDAEGVITVRMTHDELATSVGSVRETVTKTVGELARSGAISAGYGRLRLLDLAILERIAGGRSDPDPLR